MMGQKKLFDLPQLFDVYSCEVEELFNYRLDLINEELSEEEKNIFCTRVCDYYHDVVGFPYYSNIDINAEMTKAKNYNPKNMLYGDNLGNIKEIQQVMHGLNVCNMFHPHMWEVRCNGKKTPMEVFSDKDLFRVAIRKRMSMSDSKLSPFNIRKSLKIFSGSQSVSNFKPITARWVYDNYCPSGGVVLDPCMGYGGRLFGSILSDNVVSYHGVDPCQKTYQGNKKLNSAIGDGMDNKFFNLPFEDVCLSFGYYDFIFTSPPYYNIELYSDEPTQSCVRYGSYDKWVDGFLGKLILNSHKFLKSGKYFSINVAGDSLVKDVLSLAEAVGFELIDRYEMRLSKMPRRGKTKNKFKTEPIFIFRKGKNNR